MKIPESPPKITPSNLSEALRYLKDETFQPVIKKAIDNYLYWSDFKYKTSTDQIEPEILWTIVNLNRNLNAETIKISDVPGFEFKYNLTTNILQQLHELDLNLGGGPGSQDLIPDSDKSRYLINSLMEEAIASSQLEGAATTRKDAKKMLRQERKPRNQSEQMILNNYLTIKKLKDHKDEELTPGLILDIHSSITKDTLDDPAHEGHIRQSNDISVVNSGGEVVYVPPDCKYLDKIIGDFCVFANRTNEKRFIHPIIKAGILHFLIGYIHPFVDGNGRTARAIFYWYLLKNGYWLIEYTSISRMIIQSKTQYSKAYLHTELDDNDVTYFINYQLRTMRQALSSLKEYVDNKVREESELYDIRKIRTINERQASLLKSLMDEPNFTFTIKEIQNRFNTAYQTARTDILGLEELGLIDKKIVGKKKILYYRCGDFDVILSKLMN